MLLMWDNAVSSFLFFALFSSFSPFLSLVLQCWGSKPGASCLLGKRLSCISTIVNLVSKKWGWKDDLLGIVACFASLTTYCNPYSSCKNSHCSSALLKSQHWGSLICESQRPCCKKQSESQGTRCEDRFWSSHTFTRTCACKHQLYRSII